MSAYLHDPSSGSDNEGDYLSEVLKDQIVDEISALEASNKTISTYKTEENPHDLAPSGEEPTVESLKAQLDYECQKNCALQSYLVNEIHRSEELERLLNEMKSENRSLTRRLAEIMAANPNLNLPPMTVRAPPTAGAFPAGACPAAGRSRKLPTSAPPVEASGPLPASKRVVRR
jgi:hypothetical protein